MKATRRGLVTLGGLVMAYAVLGALADPDVRPLRHLLFLSAVLVAHDAVLLPLAIGTGVLIGRYLPVRVRVAVGVAAFVTAALLVAALPLILGFGRRTDTPSALPLNYGWGFTVTTVAVWTAALTVAAVRRAGRPAATSSSTGRTRRTGPGRESR
jgi:hypothetical protein